MLETVKPCVTLTGASGKYAAKESDDIAVLLGGINKFAQLVL